MAEFGIIGAGIGGLAMAIRLAVRGEKVVVFEKGFRAGGKISEIRKDGYRFDTGPSLFTLPELVDELFVLAGKNSADAIPYKKLDLSCRYFFEEGPLINAYTKPDDFSEEAAYKTNTPKSRTTQYLWKSRRIYRITSPVFIFHSIHRLKDIFSSRILKALWRIPQIYPFKSLHAYNVSAFNNDCLVRIFDRFATYNGSNPYKAPATLSVISHLEHNVGAFFPQKGMYSIVEGLFRQAEKLGVKFRFNCAVEKIMHISQRITGLVADGKEYLFDAVISDVDAAYVYKHLLHDTQKLHSELRKERSSSALIFYWSVEKTHPELDVHNILFANNYREEFEYLFKRKEVYHDPTVYIFISTKATARDAPVGCENWFVMINVPANDKRDYSDFRNRARLNILRKIKSMLGHDIEKSIVGEDVLDPLIIEDRTSSLNGSLYGSSSNSKFSAFRRHANFSSKYKGLYFVGGSVHPGGGIPLCLASAKITEELIYKP